MNAGIIVAVGSGGTMGGNVDRGFLHLGSAPVLAYSLQAFERCPEIDTTIVIVKRDRIEAAQAVARMFGCAKVTTVIAGTSNRLLSIENAMAELDDDYKMAVIQDAYCPCVTTESISKTIKTAKRYGSGVAARRVEDSVKIVEKGQVIKKSLDPKTIWIAQSPQAFKLDLLKKGIAAANKAKVTPGDESSAVELVTKDVRLVPVDGPNIRINNADDLTLAAAILKL
ncbi:MAG: 2-C-methyl-D-erythritol 4-phosphate cytidylyltransferase [Kiritimatiellae bacterium]|nr:2-C-methyl-D-erythritol 4-phosphate cytidylyltransferase [Kiritimatiellia bacterium]